MSDELDEGQYVVEEVLKMRKRRGKKEYYVKWLNYDSSQNTWEPEANMDCCPEALEKFFEAEAASKSLKTPSAVSACLPSTSRGLTGSSGRMPQRTTRASLKPTDNADSTEDKHLSDDNLNSEKPKSAWPNKPQVSRFSVDSSPKTMKLQSQEAKSSKPLRNKRDRRTSFSESSNEDVEIAKQEKAAGPVKLRKKRRRAVLDSPDDSLSPASDVVVSSGARSSSGDDSIASKNTEVDATGKTDKVPREVIPDGRASTAGELEIQRPSVINLAGKDGLRKKLPADKLETPRSVARRVTPEDMAANDNSTSGEIDSDGPLERQALPRPSLMARAEEEGSLLNNNPDIGDISYLKGKVSEDSISVVGWYNMEEGFYVALEINTGDESCRVNTTLRSLDCFPEVRKNFCVKYTETTLHRHFNDE